MKRYSKKSLEKRKEERKEFPEFFQKHIQIIRDNRLCCEECGVRLIGDVSEVAHILPKQTYKSISTLDENVLYLCGWKSPNNCHTKFDNGSNEDVHEMSIYEKVHERYLELIQVLTERLNWKIADRYDKNIK